MPRMPAAATLLAAITIQAPSALAEAPTLRVCPGVRVDIVEQRVPSAIRRFAFEGAMLEPFLELWSSGRRPHLPIPPERVTVYAVPKHPYLVGFQRAGCVIAFLKVERQKLWQALRVRVGWPA